MSVLKRVSAPSGRSIIGALRRPARNAAAVTAQTARHRFHQIEGAALTFGGSARRRAGDLVRTGLARGRQSPILTGVLLVAAVTGGVLLVSARARAALRSGVKGLAPRAAGRPRPLTANQEDHLEALLDEGLAESFPASDPPSVHRIS